MSEPTHRQHKILEKVNVLGGVDRTGKEPDIKLYWELVRGGYLHNLVLMMGFNEWRFELTEEGENYLEESENPNPQEELGDEER